MPSPTPEVLQRLLHLPMAEQMAWLNRWSTALLEGQEPPPLPPPPLHPIEIRESPI